MSTGPGLGYHIVDKGGAATLPGSPKTFPARLQIPATESSDPFGLST